MSTLAQLVTATKEIYRESTSELDTFISNALNRAYLQWAHKFDWKGLKVEDASLTLIAGTEAYALPSNFYRIDPNSIRYAVTTTPEYPGTHIEYKSNEDFDCYRKLFSSNSPWVATVTTGTAPLRKLEFAPSFTETNQTVLYDYFKTPAALTDSDSPEIPELEQIMTYQTLYELAVYHNDQERKADYMNSVREWKNANLTTVFAQ